MPTFARTEAVDPTVSALSGLHPAENPDSRYLIESDRDPLALVELFDPERKLRPVYFHRLGEVGALHRARVGILAGTDTPGGFTLHEELALLVESGLTPLAALQAATLNPARYLGLEAETGTLAPGKSADIILLDGNPLDDIANTRMISDVFLNGTHLDRHALDRMLAQVERDAGASGE